MPFCTAHGARRDEVTMHTLEYTANEKKPPTSKLLLSDCKATQMVGAGKGGRLYISALFITRRTARGPTIEILVIIIRGSKLEFGTATARAESYIDT